MAQDFAAALAGLTACALVCYCPKSAKGGEVTAMKFDCKAGVVTGAGSGIGRATAMEFARRGGAIVVADINEETANSVAREISRNGGKATAIGADVTRDADVDAMLALATKQFGRLDFLHNNAFGLPP